MTPQHDPEVKPDDVAGEQVAEEQTVNLAGRAPEAADGPGAVTVDMSSRRAPDPATDLPTEPIAEPAAVASRPDPSLSAVPAPPHRSPADGSAADAPESPAADDGTPAADPPGVGSADTVRPDSVGTSTGVGTAADQATAVGEAPTAEAGRRRLTPAGALIGVLIALFGFTLVVQLRSNNTDQGLSTMRQEDLVRILSDLEARETRLNSEIGSLEQSQRQLTSGVQGRQAALQEADRRANELGLLAGTLPGRGPGLVVEIRPGASPIKASAVLNTVQELRGAGGEVMQIAGANGAVVRVVASTAFVDGTDGVVVDDVHLTGPYVLTVIGAPQTMETALNIPGGVVASVGNAGGTVIAEQRKAVDVTAVRKATSLRFARPVS